MRSKDVRRQPPYGQPVVGRRVPQLPNQLAATFWRPANTRWEAWHSF